MAIRADCVAYLQSYKAAILVGKQAFAASEAGSPPDVPPELVEAILAAVAGC
jgi:hypothetical protein